MTTQQIATVQFHNQSLITIKSNETEYVAMKSIVEGMGLDWMGQYRKLTTSDRYRHISIPAQTNSGVQETLCMPLMKLPGGLFYPSS